MLYPQRVLMGIVGSAAVALSTLHDHRDEPQVSTGSRGQRRTKCGQAWSGRNVLHADRRRYWMDT